MGSAAGEGWISSDEEFALRRPAHCLGKWFVSAFCFALDVAEEIQRIHFHLEEIKRALTSKEAIGRRLDFLMQELNREANTLGSKSMDTEVTQCVVEIKVQIEQMREQVQNIE